MNATSLALRWFVVCAAALLLVPNTWSSTAPANPLDPAAALTPTALARTTAALDRYEYRRVVMGVEARIVLYSTDEKTALAATEAAWRRLDELDAALSDWREDSELSRLSAADVGQPRTVSPDLAAVLRAAQQVSALSEGAFDITVGPYVKAWRAGRASGQPPSDEQLRALAGRVGWDRVRLTDDGQALVELAGMALDLGGVAKGYAAQQALATLAGFQLPRALVSLGGDVAVGKQPPDRDGWLVLAGCADGHEVQLELVNSCVSTSGDTAQALDADGQRHSHVLDPRSGRAVTHRTCAVVVADDGARADALASAVQVLGPRAGRILLGRVPSASLVLAERLDRPTPRSLHDPRRLWRDIPVRFSDDSLWTRDGGRLRGRLSPDDESSASFARPSRWSLEFDVLARGDALPFLDLASGQPASQRMVLHAEPDRWQHWEVRCVGFDPFVSVWRDGSFVSRTRLPGTFGRDERLAVGLMPRPAEQATGAPGQVEFRNVRLAALNVLDERLFEVLSDGLLEQTSFATEQGWQDLLEDGLGRWEARHEDVVSDPTDYVLHDGVLSIPARPPTGELRTRDDYRDFRLRLDFQLSPGANSGLFLRGDRRLGGDPAYSGCEVQIIDDHGWEAIAGFPLKGTQQCGSLYGAIPADSPQALRPTGEWNTYEVLYRGSRLAVALNGHVLYDVDTLELAAEPPFAERAVRGFLGFQRYGAAHVESEVALRVRNVFVQDLSAPANAGDYLSLFDGESLDGWVRVNGAPDTFVARDGLLVCNGQPTCVLRTERMFENFIFEMEWRHMQPGGNAGLFVWSDPLPALGQPFTRAIEVQVLDGVETANYTSHGDIFSIWGARMTPDRPHPNGWERCLPLVKLAKPSPEWNTYRVTCDQGMIKLEVNGREVSGAYDVSPRKGYLCLESEGSEVHFRNLRLFELPPTPSDASEQAASMQAPASGGRREPAPVSTEMEGFRPLYTGVDLDGWLTGPEHRDHWTSRGHILDYDGEGDTLWTTESFEDFELLMDWRWTGEPRGDSVPVVQSDGSTLRDAAGQDILREVLTAGDSGIYLRGNSKNQINIWCWPVGSGELYGYRTDLSMPPEVRAAATPSLAADAPLGQWNRFHITLVGDRITVELNGEIVIDDAWLPDIAPSGPIALQHHGDPIQFCNLFVREL